MRDAIPRSYAIFFQTETQMKYFIIAGEASGDLHAAELIRELKKVDSDAGFRFLGGDLMAAEAGVGPVIHYRDMAFMGFSEVLRNLGRIRRNFKTARAAIKEYAPDRLILVDYPSFNLKMAAFAKKLGIKTVYFISPKVWAWKKWRVRTIRKVVDQMLCIFPFEVDFYRRYGMEVTYVGNPSVEEVRRHLAEAPDWASFAAAHRLRPNRPLLVLMPGSRLGEIKNNLPVMAETARRFPQYQAVVAGAPGVDAGYYGQFTRLPVLHGATWALLRHARGALVTSGTATLETAIARVPQIAMYRANGSRLSYNIMKRLLSVRFVTLPNLIADSAIIPEMLLHLCTPDAIYPMLGSILPDGESRASMLDAYDAMLSRLGSTSAAANAASAIFKA